MRITSFLVTGMLAFSLAPDTLGTSGASGLDNFVVATISSSPKTSTPGSFVANGANNSGEPSGQGPMGPTALSGYQQIYVNDFAGNSLPSGWHAYSGIPAGDPGAQWALSHVTVGNGLLQLNTWQDPAYGGKWVSGGLSQSGTPRTYGAYFVRSRVTGAGPTQVELLWPTVGWPPEVDFSETNGGTSFSLATLHFTAANQQVHSTIKIDMTQWHTWGVIWTPTSVTYTVDGRVWGQDTTPTDVPQQPMTLDLQQQTWCATPASAACPTAPESMLVDWVAEYRSVESTTSTMTVPTGVPVSTSNFIVGPFSANSATLTTSVKRSVGNLARRIKTSRVSRVVLTGYGNHTPSKSNSRRIARARAFTVERYLQRLLKSLHATGVTVTVRGSPGVGSKVTNPMRMG